MGNVHLFVILVIASSAGPRTVHRIAFVQTLVNRGRALCLFDNAVSDGHVSTELHGLQSLGNISDFSECTFTIFASKSAAEYIHLLRTGTIPIVPKSVEVSHFSVISFWLYAGVWFLSEDSESVSDFLEMCFSNELSDAIQQNLLNLAIQRDVARFHLPHPTMREETRALGPLRIFVAIISRKNACETREAIRRTWLRSMASSRTEIVYRFFLGKSESAGCEGETDIVMLDVDEKYVNLTKKLDLLLRWLRDDSNQAFDLLLKFDDDIYVRPDPIIRHLETSWSELYVWGSFSHTSVPIREAEDGMHIITFDQYPFDDSFYPVYPRGFAYGLSRELMDLIIKSRGTSEGDELLIHFEDVSIGYTINRLVTDGVPIVMDDRCELNFARIPSCHPSVESNITPETWIVHHVTAEQILCIHSHDLSHKDICACT
jgi:hypothetical protein